LGSNYVESLTFDKSAELWVTLYNTSTIEVFAGSASGNASPLFSIAGSNTTLNSPTDVAFDTAGDVFVANYGANSILEFAKGATGNVAPIATISGSNTLLDGVASVAIDATGNIYAANYLDAALLIFAKGSNGNVAPTATLPNGGTLSVLLTHGNAPIEFARTSLNFYQSKPVSGSSATRTIKGTKTNLFGCGYCSSTL